MIENRNGFYAGLLAATEVGLGSALHAARIPLRGQFLSLNQIFILLRASLEESSSRFSPAMISNAAAVLKSLSPAGNKLTPMIAIAMQGWLFTLGILLFGHTFLGRFVGGALASLWAFIQPILLYGMIFGLNTLSSSFKEIFSFFPASESILLYCIGSLALLKIGLVIVLMQVPASWMDKYLRKINSTSKIKASNPALSPIKGALKQICKPLFLGSIVLSASFLYFAEKSAASLIWHLMRPLAVGFLLFYFLRLIPIQRLISSLENKSLFGQTLSAALNRIRTHSKISTLSPTDKTP